MPLSPLGKATFAARDYGVVQTHHSTKWELPVRILYVMTTGSADATKASMAFHLAVNGSAAIGDQPEIFIAGDGSELLIGDTVGSVIGVGVPAMTDLVALVREHRVPVHV